MTRMTRTARTSMAAASAALALAACGDGQTGPDYRGEPLMSLRGVVTSSGAALSADLVPALIFNPASEVVPNRLSTTYFVKSEVEGTFPSAFTMRVYDPPPQAVLEPLFEGEPAYTTAQIGAVSLDHPAWLRKVTNVEVTDEGETEHYELCANTGECIDGYPDCAANEQGEQDPNAAWPCGETFPDELPWEVYGYSRGYAVSFFDGDVAAGSVLSRLFAGGEAIAGGYHAVRLTDWATLPEEEKATRSACVNGAAAHALEAVNAQFGTTASFLDLSPEMRHELMRQQLIGYADDGCKLPAVLIADSESEPIELPFTDQPQQFGW